MKTLETQAGHGSRYQCPPPPSRLCRCFLCSAGLAPTDAYLHRRNHIHDFGHQTDNCCFSWPVCRPRVCRRSFGQTPLSAKRLKSQHRARDFPERSKSRGGHPVATAKTNRNLQQLELGHACLPFLAFLGRTSTSCFVFEHCCS